MAKVSIDTKALRKALAPHIATAERAVKAAEQKAGKKKAKGGRATRADIAEPDTQAALNHARQMLNALKSAQYALAAACCDPATQGCEFEI